MKPDLIAERVHARLFVWISVLFVIGLAQEPLFSDNQNTKYLQGAGAAGYGHLEHDWMANTTDPLPVFSAIVRGMFAVGAPELSYLFFALLAALYAVVLTKIVRQTQLCDLGHARTALLFVAGFLLLHAIPRKLSYGLAGQYVLGTYFQPAVFGVLLLWAIQQYLAQNTWRALILCAATSYFHPDYLPSCIVVAATMSVMDAAGTRVSWRVFAQRFAVFLLLLVPILLTLLPIIARTSDEAWRQSLDVLTRVRIPEHASVSAWFGGSATVGVLIMVAGAWLAPPRLRALMLALLGVILVPMALTLVVRVPLIEAITPWRASVFLVPLALTVLLGRGLARLKVSSAGRLMAVSVGIIVLALIIGIHRQWTRIEDYQATRSMPLIHAASEMAQAGQVYVVPPRDSAFYRFRLETGLPIVINWKTHPYRDVELLGWYERFRAADAFYTATNREQACDMLMTMRRYDATHVVIPQTHVLYDSPCAGAAAYRDERYAIHTVAAPSATTDS